MEKYQKTLLNALSNELFGTQHKVEINKDVLNEACAHAVLLLVSQSSPFSKSVMVNNMRVYKAHSELHKLLGDIPHVFIKGYASASYYSNPVLRQAGDVDFYINESDADKVIDLLVKNGYERCNSDLLSDHHIEFEKYDIVYELHFSVNGIPDNNLHSVIENKLKNIIDDSHMVETAFGPIRITSDYHYCLVSLLHIVKHISTSGIGLRHLCDWAVFVDKTPDFEAVYKKELLEIGLWTFVCQLTSICCKYLGLPPVDWAGEWSDDFLEDFISNILSVGNFGYKKEDNKESLLTINIYGGGTYSDNYLKQLFHNLTVITEMHWESAKKHKILIPVGCVYFSLRYAVRMLFGKRDKINVKSMVSSANEKKSIINDFHLFETN